MSDLGFPKGDVLVPRCGRYLNVQLFALQNFALFHLHSFLRMSILLRNESLLKKTLISFWTLRSATATTVLTVKSTKTRGNYSHTGHQKYQPNGREIALQEPYTEPKTSPQILIAT